MNAAQEAWEQYAKELKRREPELMEDEYALRCMRGIFLSGICWAIAASRTMDAPSIPDFMDRLDREIHEWFEEPIPYGKVKVN